eukprot:gene22952-27760_t
MGQLRASYALAMAYLDAKTNPLALPAGLPADAPVIWSELTLEARQEWTALDWARYFSYRHSLECFLVLTFAAGTGPRDVVHGGYLFFSLVFLRLRDRRSKGMLALAEETTQRELGPRRQLWQEAVPVEGDKPNSAQNTFTVTAENDTAQELPAVDVGEKVHLLARIQSRLAVMLEDRDKEREQLCALLYHLPRWIESVFTNIMP